jgi:hypothetical protein
VVVRADRGGVGLIWCSTPYHAAHATPEKLAEIRAVIGEDLLHLNPGGTYPGITMPAMMTAEAAANHVWISCPNSSARESCWGAFFVRADGVTTGRLPRNRAGVLISTVDTDADLYDSTAAWRGGRWTACSTAEPLWTTRVPRIAPGSEPAVDSRA